MFCQRRDQSPPCKYTLIIFVQHQMFANAVQTGGETPPLRVCGGWVFCIAQYPQMPFKRAIRESPLRVCRGWVFCTAQYPQTPFKRATCELPLRVCGENAASVRSTAVNACTCAWMPSMKTGSHTGKRCVSVDRRAVAIDAKRKRAGTREKSLRSCSFCFVRGNDGFCATEHP